MNETMRRAGFAFLIAAIGALLWFAGGGPDSEGGELSSLGEIGGLAMLAGAVVGLILLLRALLPSRD